jgi:LysM repeat protein
VDLNVFNGTLEELYKFAGAQSITDKTTIPQKHTVAAGDTFETIANKYGVTVRELVSANPQLLKTGEQLTVPVAVAIPSEDTKPSETRTHTVKPGDTLTTIAIRYATTVAALASANNITNINNISVGQVLTIP